VTPKLNGNTNHITKWIKPQGHLKKSKVQ